MGNDQFIGPLHICYERIKSLLESKNDLFFSRIGGSDTNALIDYIRVRDSNLDTDGHYARFSPIVKRFNGFYDLDPNPSRYFEYLDLLERCYRKSTAAFLCNFQLLSLFFPEELDPRFFQNEFENKAIFSQLLQEIASANPNAQFFPYNFVERLMVGSHTLFRLFSGYLAGKRARNFTIRREY
jgi:hypothetical protein